MTSFGDENLGEALPVANDFGMQPSLRRLQPIQKSDPSTALGELKSKSLNGETLAEWAHELHLLGSHGANATHGRIARDDAGWIWPDPKLLADSG